MRNTFDNHSTKTYHHYSVGEISRLLDIPAPTIRYYDNEGVVQPNRNGSNQYRQYSVIDANYLLKTREWTSVGCSMSETRKMLNDHTLVQFEGSLTAAKARLEQEMKLLHIKQRAVNDYIDVCRSIPQQLGRIQLVRRPAMWRIAHQRYDRYQIENERIAPLSRFTNMMPAALFSFRLDLAECEAAMKAQQWDNCDMVEWGFSVKADMAEAAGLHTLPCVEYVPPCDAVYMMVCSEDEIFFKPSFFIPAIRFIQEHHFSLSGDVYGHSLLRVNSSDNNHILHYYEGWFPIRCEP